MSKNTGRIVCSTGSLAAASGSAFWRLDAALEASRALGCPVELVVLAEWCPLFPPLTPSSANWQSVTHYQPAEIADMARGIPIASIHASRDVGLLLGHGEEVKRTRGNDEIRTAQWLARELGTSRIVLHPWDTYDASLDARELAFRLKSTGVDLGLLSLENVPVSDPSWSQTELLVAIIGHLHGAPHITLDLNWTSLHESLDDFLKIVNLVDNVHVHATLDGTVLRPTLGSLDISGSIARLEEAGYTGPYVLELAQPGDQLTFGQALSAIGRALGR